MECLFSFLQLSMQSIQLNALGSTANEIKRVFGSLKNKMKAENFCYNLILLENKKNLSAISNIFSMIKCNNSGYKQSQFIEELMIARTKAINYIWSQYSQKLAGFDLNKRKCFFRWKIMCCQDLKRNELERFILNGRLNLQQAVIRMSIIAREQQQRDDKHIKKFKINILFLNQLLEKLQYKKHNQYKNFSFQFLYLKIQNQRDIKQKRIAQKFHKIMLEKQRQKIMQLANLKFANPCQKISHTVQNNILQNKRHFILSTQLYKKSRVQKVSFKLNYLIQKRMKHKFLYIKTHLTNRFLESMRIYRENRKNIKKKYFHLLRNKINMQIQLHNMINEFSNHIQWFLQKYDKRQFLKQIKGIIEEQNKSKEINIKAKRLFVHRKRKFFYLLKDKYIFLQKLRANKLKSHFLQILVNSYKNKELQTFKQLLQTLEVTQQKQESFLRHFYKYYMDKQKLCFNILIQNKKIQKDIDKQQNFDEKKTFIVFLFQQSQLKKLNDTFKCLQKRKNIFNKIFDKFQQLLLQQSTKKMYVIFYALKNHNLMIADSNRKLQYNTWQLNKCMDQYINKQNRVIEIKNFQLMKKIYIEQVAAEKLLNFIDIQQKKQILRILLNFNYAKKIEKQRKQIKSNRNKDFFNILHQILKIQNRNQQIDVFKHLKYLQSKKHYILQKICAKQNTQKQQCYKVLQQKLCKDNQHEREYFLISKIQHKLMDSLKVKKIVSFQYLKAQYFSIHKKQLKFFNFLTFLVNKKFTQFQEEFFTIARFLYLQNIKNDLEKQNESLEIYNKQILIPEVQNRQKIVQKQKLYTLQNYFTNVISEGVKQLNNQIKKKDRINKLFDYHENNIKKIKIFYFFKLLHFRRQIIFTNKQIFSLNQIIQICQIHQTFISKNSLNIIREKAKFSVEVEQKTYAMVQRIKKVQKAVFIKLKLNFQEKLNQEKHENKICEQSKALNKIDSMISKIQYQNYYSFLQIINKKLKTDKKLYQIVQDSQFLYKSKIFQNFRYKIKKQQQKNLSVQVQKLKLQYFVDKLLKIFEQKQSYNNVQFFRYLFLLKTDQNKTFIQFVNQFRKKILSQLQNGLIFNLSQKQKTNYNLFCLLKRQNKQKMLNVFQILQENNVQANYTKEKTLYKIFDIYNKKFFGSFIRLISNKNFIIQQKHVLKYYSFQIETLFQKINKKLKQQAIEELQVSFVKKIIKHNFDTLKEKKKLFDTQQKTQQINYINKKFLLFISNLFKNKKNILLVNSFQSVKKFSNLLITQKRQQALIRLFCSISSKKNLAFDALQLVPKEFKDKSAIVAQIVEKIQNQKIYLLRTLIEFKSYHITNMVYKISQLFKQKQKEHLYQILTPAKNYELLGILIKIFKRKLKLNFISIFFQLLFGTQKSSQLIQESLLNSQLTLEDETFIDNKKNTIVKLQSSFNLKLSDSDYQTYIVQTQNPQKKRKSLQISQIFDLQQKFLILYQLRIIFNNRFKNAFICIQKYDDANYPGKVRQVIFIDQQIDQDKQQLLKVNQKQQNTTKQFRFNKNRVSLLETLQEEKIALLNKIIEDQDINSDDLELEDEEFDNESVIEGLNQEIDELERQRIQLEVHEQNLIKQKEIQQKTKSFRQQSLKNIQASNQNLTLQLDQQEKQNQKIQLKIDKIEGQLNQFQQQHDNIEEKLQQDQQNIQLLNSQVNNKKQELRVLIDEKSKKNKDLKQIKLFLEQKQQHQEILKNELKQYQNNEKQVKRNTMQRTESQHIFQQNIENLTEKIGQKQMQLLDIQYQEQQLQQQVKQLCNQKSLHQQIQSELIVTTYEDDPKQKLQRQGSIKLIQQGQDQIFIELKECEDKINQLNTQKNDLQVELTQLQNQLQSQEHNEKNLKKQQVIDQIENKENEKRVQEITLILNAMNIEIEQKQQQLKNVKCEIQKQDEEELKLKDSLIQNANDIREFSKELKYKQEFKQQIQDQIKKLTSERQIQEDFLKMNKKIEQNFIQQPLANNNLLKVDNLDQTEFAEKHQALLEQKKQVEEKLLQKKQELQKFVEQNKKQLMTEQSQVMPTEMMDSEYILEFENNLKKEIQELDVEIKQKKEKIVQQQNSLNTIFETKNELIQNINTKKKEINMIRQTSKQNIAVEIDSPGQNIIQYYTRRIYQNYLLKFQLGFYYLTRKTVQNKYKYEKIYCDILPTIQNIIKKKKSQVFRHILFIGKIEKNKIKSDAFNQWKFQINLNEIEDKRNLNKQYLFGIMRLRYIFNKRFKTAIKSFPGRVKLKSPENKNSFQKMILGKVVEIYLQKKHVKKYQYYFYWKKIAQQNLWKRKIFYYMFYKPKLNLEFSLLRMQVISQKYLKLKNFEEIEHLSNIIEFFQLRDGFKSLKQNMFANMEINRFTQLVGRNTLDSINFDASKYSSEAIQKKHKSFFGQSKKQIFKFGQSMRFKTVKPNYNPKLFFVLKKFLQNNIQKTFGNIIDLKKKQEYTNTNNLDTATKENKEYQSKIKQNEAMLQGFELIESQAQKKISQINKRIVRHNVIHLQNLINRKNKRFMIILMSNIKQFDQLIQLYN